MMKRISAVVIWFVCFLSIPVFCQYDDYGDDYMEAVSDPEPASSSSHSSSGKSSYKNESSNLEITEILTNSNYKTEAISGVSNCKWFYVSGESYSDTRYGVIKDNKILLPMIFKRDSYGSSFGNVEVGIENYFGIYDLIKERWKVPMIYTSISKTNDNLYTVGKNKYYGLIDQSNNIIIPIEYSNIDVISEYDNYFKLTKKDDSFRKMGIYNIISKKFTIPLEFQSISSYNLEYNFLVQDKTEGYNLSDINGNLKFKYWYKELVAVNKGATYLIAKKDDLYGVIDLNEKIVVSFDYKLIKSSAYNDGSHLSQHKNGKWGCMLLDGKVTLPFIYDDLSKSYSNSLIAISDGKCGIIRTNSGNPFEVTTCQYDDIDIESKELFILKKDKKFGIMNSFGVILTPIEFDEITPIAKGYNSVACFVGVKKNKYYIIDASGVAIVQTSYDYLGEVVNENNSYYSKSVNYLIYKNGGTKSGIVDLAGNKVTEPIFDEILFSSDYYIFFKDKGLSGVYYMLTKTNVLKPEYSWIVRSQNSFYALKNEKFLQIETNADKITNETVVLNPTTK